MSCSLRELIESVDAVKMQVSEEHARRLASGAEFNVYELCGVSHYELMHSKILAEILSPTGMHGQGARFLAMIAEEFGLSGFGCDAKASLEVKGYVGNRSVGRFDIFIEDRDAVCIIENKIYAGEQDQQLARYRKFLDDEKHFKQISKDKRFLIFLTLDGRDATTLDRGYVKIPYCSKEGPSICSWLDRCAKEVGEMISVPLRLYRNHVMELALGERVMKENVTKCLIGNMETASIVAKYYDEAAMQIKQNIMDEVTSLLPDEIRRNILGVDDKWCDFNVKQYNVRGVSGWAYRVNRNLCKIKNADVWLRVFVDEDYCQVGVFAEDFGVERAKKLFKKWCQGKQWDGSGWISEDAYPLYRDVVDIDGKTYKFDPLSLDKIANVKDASYRKAFAASIVDALEKLYRKLSEFECEMLSASKAVS